MGRVWGVVLRLAGGPVVSVVAIWVYGADSCLARGQRPQMDARSSRFRRRKKVGASSAAKSAFVVGPNFGVRSVHYGMFSSGSSPEAIAAFQAQAHF